MFFRRFVGAGVQREAISPLYMVGEEEDPESDNLGPDKITNDIPSKDREQELFMRCLNEIEKSALVEMESAVAGETTYDFFERLAKEPPYSPKNFEELVTRVVPLLRRETHTIQLVVWATTPSSSARTRAVRQSAALANEIRQQADFHHESAESHSRKLSSMASFGCKTPDHVARHSA